MKRGDSFFFFCKTNMNRICSVDLYACLDYWFTLDFPFKFCAYKDSLELIVMRSVSEMVEEIFFFAL